MNTETAMARQAREMQSKISRMVKIQELALGGVGRKSSGGPPMLPSPAAAAEQVERERSTGRRPTLSSGTPVSPQHPPARNRAILYAETFRANLKRDLARSPERVSTPPTRDGWRSY